MESPKKIKKPKQIVAQKPNPAPLQRQLTDEEKAKLVQQKQFEHLRFYQEQEVKQKIKAKTSDAKELQLLLKEYLSAYVLIGFDVTGETLTIRDYNNNISQRALDDLFHEYMVKFQMRKSKEFQSFD